MRPIKIIDSLRSLNARERNRWRQFVWSDSSNRHKALRALCDILLDAAPGFDELEDKQSIYGRLFGPNVPYDEYKYNNLASDLYELLLDWMAQERLQADAMEQQRQRVEALLERDLNKQAAAALEKYRQLLERSPLRNGYWFRHATYVESLAEVLHSRQPRRSDSPYLFRQAQYNHYSQVLERLKLSLAMRSRSQLAVIQAGEGDFFQHDIQQLRSDRALQEALPIVQCYFAAFDLLEQSSRDTFQGLTAALERLHELLDREELAALYQCALNYCIRCINAGQADAYTDALELYRTLLDKRLLLQRGGKLSQWTYKNIATTALRSGAFEWTEQFLHQYRDALPADERDNAFAFNLATLYFEKQEWSLTLQTLQNVEFTEFSYHFGAKLLQLKTYYLIGEEEALISLLATSEQLLRRDKTLSPFGKTTNHNFLRMFRHLSAWKQKRKWMRTREATQKKQALWEKIAALQPLSNRDWLLKQAEALP